MFDAGHEIEWSSFTASAVFYKRFLSYNWISPLFLPLCLNCIFLYQSISPDTLKFNKKPNKKLEELNKNVKN